MIHRCLERERTVRVQSVGELAGALVVYAPDEAISARRIARLSGVPANPTVAAAPGGATVDARPPLVSQPASIRTEPGITSTNRPSMPVASQPPRRSGATAWLVGIVLSLGAGGVAVLFVHEAWRFSKSLRGEAKAAAVETPRAQTASNPTANPTGGGPDTPAGVRAGFFLLDADDDGTPDVLGVFNPPPGSPVRPPWLGAVSGADGHVLWRGEPEEGDDTRRALVDTTLLVLRSGAGGDVWLALDAKTGHELWTQDPGGPVGELCASPGEIGWRAPDGGALVRFVALTGVRVDPASTEPCGHAYTSSDDGPNFTVASGPAAERAAGSPAALASANLAVRLTLVPVIGVARVLLGDARTGGDAVVAVVASGKVLWRASIAAPGQAAVRWADRPRAAVRHGRVFVPYGREAPREVRVAAFDLSTGQRAWDVALEGEASAIDGIAVSNEGRVFARTVTGRVWSLGPGGEDRRLVIGGS